MVDLIDAHYDELLDELDAEERRQLGVLVRKVLDRLEAVTDMPSDVSVASEPRKGEHDG